MVRSTSSRAASASATAPSAEASCARTVVSSIVARSAPAATTEPSDTATPVSRPITCGATAAVIRARTVPSASAVVSRGTGRTTTTSTSCTTGREISAPCFPFSPQAESPAAIQRIVATAAARAPNEDIFVTPFTGFSPSRFPRSAQRRRAARRRRTTAARGRAARRSPRGSGRRGRRRGRLRVEEVHHPAKVVLVPGREQPHTLLRRRECGARISPRSVASFTPRSARAASNAAWSRIPRWYAWARRRSATAFPSSRLAAHPVEEVPGEPHAHLPGAVVGGEGGILGVHLIRRREADIGQISRLPEPDVAPRVREPQRRGTQVGPAGCRGPLLPASRVRELRR